MSKALSQLNTDLSLACATMSSTGLQFDDGATLEQWEEVGDYLTRVGGAVNWWIGDWLLYGEGRPEWGDKYEEAIERFGRKYDSIAQVKSVSKNIEFCTRVQDLSWAHHRAVASLPPKEQKNWLLSVWQLGKASAIEHYATKLKAGIEVERPIALGVLKIKAKLGELMPANKGGRGKKLLKQVEEFSAQTASAYRKLAANKNGTKSAQRSMWSHEFFSEYRDKLSQWRLETVY